MMTKRMHLVVSNDPALCRMPGKVYRVMRRDAGKSNTSPATTIRSAGKTFVDSPAERFAGQLPVRYDERFVKWIPIVVPLFAILLAVGAYFILRMVL